jgi:hypothetical protein
LRQEHDAADESSSRRYGPFHGRGRGDHSPGVRDLRAAGAGPRSALRTGYSYGQVMDNLGAHQPRRVRALIEAKGSELIYLPSYSPDFNPIEQALSKVKDILRKTSVRTKEILFEAIGSALAAVSAQDVRGFFAHCGYCTTAQQL